MKHKKTITVVAGMIMSMGAAAPALADTGATGSAAGSPGIGSGNAVQVPVQAPTNACGNTVDAGALLNPTSGNPCTND